MCRKHAWVGLVLLVLAGCYGPVRPAVDALVCASANRPMDAQPTFMPGADAAQPNPKQPAAFGAGATDPKLTTRPDGQLDELLLAAAQDKKAADQPKGQDLLEKRLTPPRELAGSNVPKIVWPDLKNKAALEEAARKYFPPQPELGDEQVPGPSPTGKPLTLADLQQLAHANNPLLRQAASDVSAAQGAMIQAGLYSNPTISMSGYTQGPSGGPAYGTAMGQTISTMGKLKLAQAAAEKNLEITQLAYRRAETDLMASVRGAYFGVLVSAESVRQNRALCELTDEIYKVIVGQLKGGEFSPSYEPAQVGVFAQQARLGLIQARNSYTLAWKNLAVALGLPGMPPTQLAGQIRDLPLPKYRYETALAHVLANHTDVATALTSIEMARYNLRLAEVTVVPDVNASVGITDDETQPGPYRITGNFSVSMAVPVWNMNQGAVQQAKAALMRAIEEPHRVRDDLTSRVADAYQRYSVNFEMLDLYHKQILPKQVQSYMAAVKRYNFGEPGGVAFLDLVSAEQNVVSVIGSYLTTLQAQWQAVADLGSLLQTNDIFQLAEDRRFAEIPDIKEMLQFPCCHPCNPLPNDDLKGADMHWPEPGFRTKLGSPTAMDR